MRSGSERGRRRSGTKRQQSRELSLPEPPGVV
jgi:hypothetical protein